MASAAIEFRTSSDVADYNRFTKLTNGPEYKNPLIDYAQTRDFGSVSRQLYTWEREEIKAILSGQTPGSTRPTPAPAPRPSATPAPRPSATPAPTKTPAKPENVDAYTDVAVEFNERLLDADPAVAGRLVSQFTEDVDALDEDYQRPEFIDAIYELLSSYGWNGTKFTSTPSISLLAGNISELIP